MSTPDALPILPQHEATHTHGGNCSYAPKDKNRTIKRLQIITICLLGLVLNATLHIRWVDPLAALVAIPIIVIEA